MSGWCEDSESCQSPTSSAEHVLLQKAQSREVVESHTNSDMETAKIKASSVPLNDEGYKMIAKLKNDHEMFEFIARVATELGFEISEDYKLNGVVPYYSGKKATQSFAALTTEMGKTSKGSKGWARTAGAKRKYAYSSSGQILLQSNQQVAASHSKVTANRVNSSSELPMKAAEVSLDEDGYTTIAKLNSEREMLYFVKRVAEENGYKISDIGSLHGVVPYYSGKKATQSFIALQDELARTSEQPQGWARKSGKQQKASAHLIDLQLDENKKKEKDENEDERPRGKDASDKKTKEKNDEHGDKHTRKKHSSDDKKQRRNNEHGDKHARRNDASDDKKTKDKEEHGDKHTSKKGHSKLSAKHAGMQNIDDKRKDELASIHRMKDTRNKTLSKKTTEQDEMPAGAHPHKDEHDSKGNHKHSEDVHKAKVGMSEHKKSTRRHVETKRSTGQKHKEDTENKRHVTDNSDVAEAQNDLDSTEASEMDETMLAASLHRDHAKLKSTHEGAIKKKDVATLHVVGKVKVETGRLGEPKHATQTPPAKNDP